ncbi:transcriptional regulator [Thermanaerovibrio velox DSM 12556]|uniref:Transcriptional regulator n=1 Tax=Thermanaerovibrio velox DSM 12556 TaxID=926567 RepID=H0UP98_9BACT|nr:MarR family transcriptional regulator [Thermanaerovibrio velox]EHM09511.1 transcriptional regulator [Thermanaerovibrio velox DSM 12556]
MRPSDSGMREKASALRAALRGLVRGLGLLDRDGACCGGVTLAQCHALGEIADSGGLSLMELSRRLGLHKSTVSRTVDPLVEMGLVAQERDPLDRRRYVLSLTAKGVEVERRISATVELRCLRILEALDPASHDKVLSGVEELLMGLRKALEKEEGECDCVDL